MTTLDPRAIEIAAKWLEDEKRTFEAADTANRDDCPFMADDGFPADAIDDVCDRSTEVYGNCLHCVLAYLVAAHHRAIERARQDDEPPSGIASREQAEEAVSLIAGVTDVTRGRKPAPCAAEEGGPA